ncbi:MAG TPA: phosphatidylserine decarboxylase family protein [Candidatus Sphingobacterium stercoripullorum]|uniref:Phosphatidylserine decarboxylase proenzyme n=1 Tax=Candidatus Sphingobacterium stercoripullorum TaxID=2838759 RepID=A0A9D2AZ37_9SPHI|nr:phosphatidylserine decarboxylase family protein [Candidatus Sphingobacterium stercoripullorum]HLR49405.1 phosphatidylserine decarboxylase family protein [Candidatus Sphingobacterium stercoripullorum]
MKFHKEGYVSLFLVLLIIVILQGLVAYFGAAEWFRWFIHILSAFLLITILQFFRSPSRDIQRDEKTILCPADGKVVVIEETQENEYFKDKRLQVSIFMSPTNVHVNRNPISGVVNYFKYHPGKYLVAWHPKSSTDNERTSIVLKDAQGKEVLMRQIAGAMARRIVWYIKEGDRVEQGEEFGFIKFGSRVDLFLPLDSQINVNIGQKVIGGKTIIGKI